MKHLHLFEAWSSAFNRTLQDAYALAKERGQRHGRSTSRVLDYTRRNVSEDKFLVDDAAGNEYVFYIDPKFLLEPFEFLALSSGYVKDAPYIPVVLESINGIPIDSSDPNLTECSIIITKDEKSSGYKPKIALRLPMMIKEFFYGKGQINLVKYQEYLDKYPDKMQKLIPILDDMKDNFSKVPQDLFGYNYEVRFPKQKQLEDFLSTYVQAIMSDPIGDDELLTMINRLVGGSTDRFKELDAFMKNPPSEGPTSSPVKNFFVSEIEKLKQFHPGYFM
jgi:hypothetical protein